MTRQKKVDLGSVADRELRRRGFGYMSGTSIAAEAAELRAAFNSMLGSQLPNHTYAYLITTVHGKYQGRRTSTPMIHKYGKREGF